MNVVYHMWHGSRRNRHFVDRYAVLNGVEDVRDVVSINEDGLYELRDPEMQAKIMQFFVNRDDDGAELIDGQ
jgi:hypothetical protein